MTNKQVKMEQHEEQPRVCQEPEVLKTVRPGPAESPPPNCAICLGTCTNKCFTDCCLHQFCFSCLLEWSKIKAECPLCKQPFKSIIYNIKSNLEYEEHIINNPERESQEDLLTLSDPSEYLFLPNGPRPRHFQYRTTFTLEPGGEFAIQQLLLSHPRTNSISFPERYPYHHRFNTSTHSVDQRRNIYIENWWVDPQPDVTGRFRECTPQFFRGNPAQADRIIPWLNRELTALINHTLIYPVQLEILNMLYEFPILSSQFRTRILPHLGPRTEHFIHEFYNFVRSPCDMIGYDRMSTYSRQRPTPIFDLSDEDSDVHVVDSPANDDCVFVPNRTPEVIVIDSESSGNDSDVIIRTPTPPPIVDLVDDTTSEEDNNHETTQPSAATTIKQQPDTENERVEFQLPIKIRLKRSRSSAELCYNYKHKERRRARRNSSSSCTSSNSSSSDTSELSSPSSNDNYKLDHKYTKKKKSKLSKKHKNSSKSNKYRHKKLKAETKEKKSKRSKKSKKQKKSKRKDSESKSKRYKRIKLEKPDSSSTHSNADTSSDEDNYHKRKRPKLFYEIKTEGVFSSNEQSNSQTSQSIESVEPAPSTSPAVTNTFETNNENWSAASTASSGSYPPNMPQDLSVAGPSNGLNLRSMVVVNNKDGSMWCRKQYEPAKRFGIYRPYLNEKSDSSSDSD